MGKYVALAGALATALWAMPGPLEAHGGGLNAEGCHNDRKRGGYHCHRGGGLQVRARLASFERSVKSRGRKIKRSNPLGIFGGGAWSYRNCSEARAAGAAPVREGSPGYGRHLDRDGDGIGCE